MNDLDKGPLREYITDSFLMAHLLIASTATEVVEVVDAAWEVARPFVTKYHH